GMAPEGVRGPRPRGRRLGGPAEGGGHRREPRDQLTDGAGRRVREHARPLKGNGQRDRPVVIDDDGRLRLAAGEGDGGQFHAATSRPEWTTPTPTASVVSAV